VGGLSSTTTDETFRAYFEKYGPLDDCVVMMAENRPRNFGFVTYQDEASFNHCLEEKPHTLDNKEVSGAKERV